MRFIHYDEAKKAATGWLQAWVGRTGTVERALLVSDLFGKLRVVLWAAEGVFEAARPELQRALEEGCGSWWTGEILPLDRLTGADRRIWEDAWNEARSDPETDRLRHLDRHRSRTAWFVDSSTPVWQASEQGPPAVVFYSFKGGVGRSTALASFAIQRARAGERVAVVDFDLDAPGIGTLLSADSNGITSPWGVVDYLLERARGEVPLADYYHPCARVAGPGEIKVFPAGALDAGYAGKLARIDLEERPAPRTSELVPQWILVDARTGLSEPAGQLLSGIAHLHVLFGTTSEQGWRGLRVVIDRLGRQRVLAEQPQAEILLVQAMVPATAESARMATNAFAERARQEFTDFYYAEQPEDPGADDRFWDVRDLDSEDAPHAPVPVGYREILADFRDIDQVADVLCRDEYAALAARIVGRLAAEKD
jgi:hypothetical protein